MFMHRSRKSRQAWGEGGGGRPGNSDNVVFIVFLVINIFHRGPHVPPSRRNWKGVQLLFESGPYQIFSSWVS